MSSDNRPTPRTKVPNLAKTTTDKILDERRALEEEAPSAPITYTPDGTKVTAKAGAKVEYQAVTEADLAVASNILFDPNKLNLASDKRHVTDGKIYLNSDEFNELRKQLYERHPKVFELIGGYMVHDPYIFVERMNQWLGTRVQFDAWNEAGICKQFLDALAKKSQDSMIERLVQEAEVDVATRLLLPGSFPTKPH